MRLGNGIIIVIIIIVFVIIIIVVVIVVIVVVIVVVVILQLPASDDQLKQMIEHAAHHLSADNTELACAFIQKTAVEKVVPEMEKRLAEVRFIHVVM